MMRTIIVPGLHGSPSPHWQHWWHMTDRFSMLVDQPDWLARDAASWDLRIARAIHANPGALVVAHSLGVVSVARLALAWPQLRIGGALLVAPADVERGIGGERLGHFGPIPREKLPFPSIVVASHNDPWMTFARARAFAADWEADFVDLGGAGHVNVASGFGPWPAGKALLRELQRKSGRPALSTWAASGGWPYQTRESQQ
jgi:Predicted esterase of the alpha/beta hydrolase fold